jgi:hypothetical protein
MAYPGMAHTTDWSLNSYTGKEMDRMMPLLWNWPEQTICPPIYFLLKTAASQQECRI